MFVSDLRDFVDVGDDSPAPARRMAAQLGMIVKAATAAEAGQSWVSGIGCTRRPGRKPCLGRIGLHRSEVPPSIRWECIACGDEGMIHGWEESDADLRSTLEAPLEQPTTVMVSYEAADLLRSVLLLDAEVERLVYRGRARGSRVEMMGDIDVFGELLDAVASEANHEAKPRRGKHLDALLSVLADALSAVESDTRRALPTDRSARIRPATVHDLEAVLRLWRDADAEPTHTDNLDSLIGLVERDPSALLIAEDAGLVVGSVIAAWDGWRGSIYRLAVAPTHRRHGLGATLVRAAEERLRSAGALRLQAIVVETSRAAVGFWTASGWERQAHRARFVKG
jgi:ribosomal protein S18 acetylase RimI-like enzyme